MTTKNQKRLVRETRQASGLLELRKTGLRSGQERLREAGRVLSADNETKLRAAADNIAAVLAALEKPDDTATEADGMMTCPTCDGSGKIKADTTECPDCKGDGKITAAKKEARSSRLLGLAEAYSAAATDAGDGAFIISQLLDLMSDESDEPGELAILQGAFNLLTQWVTLEVASIGSPDDVEDSTDKGMDMWGWEAARKRLAASGGPIQPREGQIGLKPLCEGKRIRTDLVAIAEAAVKEDGSGAIKIIQPGWGSSGYYAAEVLERDGPQIFTAGTKMFWDHPTMTEEWERPERSLRDLAGELTSDATWNAAGSAGPGLYADVRVFEDFAPVVNELAPSIGVSIRAYGKAKVGEAEGQTGQIIEELVGAESVDFVTFPGAGGQVLQLFEAARQRLGNPIPKEEAMEVEKDPKYVEMATRAARAEEAVIRTEAEKVVSTKLAEAQLPDVTRTRLAAALAANPPAKNGALDKGALEKRVDEAVAAESEYLAKLAGAGQIKGMGGPGGPGNEDLTPALEAEFRRGGLSESAAKFAAAGRR